MRSRDDSRDYGTTGHADGPLQLLPTEESQNTVKKLFVKKLSVKVMNAGGRAACHQIETRLGLPCPRPGQVQQGSGEGSAKGSGEGSRRLWCRARSGSTGFRRRFLGGFGAEPGQVKQDLRPFNSRKPS